MVTLIEWQTVPTRVADLMPRALELRTAYEKLAAETGDFAGTTATWDPDQDILILYRPGATTTLKAAADIVVVRDSRTSPPNWAVEILIKQARLPYIGAAYDAANKFLGATPLSNGIVSGLMLGGLGYGAGAAAENLFPTRYVERGKLRRNLGLAGAGAGLGFGLHNALATSRVTGRGLFRSLLTPNSTQMNLTPYSTKQSFDAMSGFGLAASPGHMQNLYAPTVSVPQFNNAAWHDAQRGMYTGGSQFTPPAYAAATTGLMSGISAAQRSPIIRPVDVIRGIASAGVGLATANIAGRALSALAGLTPAGQQKLQEIGVWGGMMHAIVPAMFNR